MSDASDTDLNRSLIAYRDRLMKDLNAVVVTHSAPARPGHELAHPDKTNVDIPMLLEALAGVAAYYVAAAGSGGVPSRVRERAELFRKHFVKFTSEFHRQLTGTRQ